MSDIELVIKIPKEVYETLRKNYIILGGKHHRGGETPMSVIYNAVVNGTPLSEQSKWILVSERLPNNHECIKNDGLFNVSDGNRSYFGWFGIYNNKKFVKPTIAGFCVDDAVIAWMPLPESYKAEREDKK